MFSSVAGALSHTGVPHFESKAVVEREIADSGVPHTVVAPVYFYDNALSGYQDIVDGTLFLPLPAGHRLQQLDRGDLGRFVALVLASPAEFAGQRFELASDEPAPADMAEALTAALGRPVALSEVPGDVWRNNDNPDMVAMWEFLNGAGYQADVAGLRRDYPSVGWTSFGEWARRTFAKEGDTGTVQARKSW